MIVMCITHRGKKITWEKLFIIKDNLDKRKTLCEYAASGNYKSTPSNCKERVQNFPNEITS